MSTIFLFAHELTEEEQCTMVIPSHKSKAAAHKTSPFIICNSHVVGGYEQLATELQKTKPFVGPLRKKRSATI
jgi:hypothetical protein